MANSPSTADADSRWTQGSDRSGVVHDRVCGQHNLVGALGSGAAPYLATEIKRRIGEDNPAANAMAHAVLGAVTAQSNGQSALAGGLGAGGGELAARMIAGQLFPGKDPDALSETEKQQISALSQLAAGIAGGLATGDAAGGGLVPRRAGMRSRITF